MILRRSSPPPAIPAEAPAPAAPVVASPSTERLTAATRLITAALREQRDRWPELRNGELINFCLDLRNVLDPSPPLPDEPSTPATPGQS